MPRASAAFTSTWSVPELIVTMSLSVDGSLLMTSAGSLSATVMSNACVSSGSVLTSVPCTNELMDRCFALDLCVFFVGQNIICC